MSGEVIEVGVRERRRARGPRSRGIASASLAWTERSGLEGVLITGPWAIDQGRAVSLLLAVDKVITLPGLLSGSVHTQSVAHEKPPARQEWGCRVQKHGASSRATATGLCNRRCDDTGLCTGLQGGDPGHRPPSNRVAGRVIALSKSYYTLGAAPTERAGDVAGSARDTTPCWCGEARYRTSVWGQPGTRRLARRVLAGAYWTHNVLGK
jgi:hypothetical protein